MEAVQERAVESYQVGCDAKDCGQVSPVTSSLMSCVVMAMRRGWLVGGDERCRLALCPDHAILAIAGFER